MDKDIVRRLDSIVEDDLRRGFRIRRLPDDVRRALEDEGLVAPQFIRLSRVNPSRRRAINEEVQRRYQDDLQNPKVLSNAQVLKLVTERGEWSDAKQRRMDELQERTTKQMAALWGEGMAPEATGWAQELVEATGRYHDLVERSSADDGTKLETIRRFDRWVGYTTSRKTDPEYRDYAPLQEQDWLFSNSPGVEAIDLLNRIEELKDRQDRLMKLTEERIELTELQLRHARIFSDTAEARRDHTEEMAQLYYTCDLCDEDGAPTGKVAPSFEKLWDFPDAAVRYLLYESFFFHNDVPDAARSYLATFGFLQAEREPSANDPSAGSPAPQSSSPAGAPAEATPAGSGA